MIPIPQISKWDLIGDIEDAIQELKQSVIHFEQRALIVEFELTIDYYVMKADVHKKSPFPVEHGSWRMERNQQLEYLKSNQNRSEQEILDKRNLMQDLLRLTE
jgi:hypothetical protein